MVQALSYFRVLAPADVDACEPAYLVVIDRRGGAVVIAALVREGDDRVEPRERPLQFLVGDLHHAAHVVGALVGIIARDEAVHL